MLAFIAAATERIGLATRVLGIPYRAPAMVAKMAETLDRLSGGRLILGLGGGSGDDEHRAFGLGVRTPKEKTDGLIEAVDIIRGLWHEASFSYRGHLYHTEEATITPRPSRAIPIWLGTFAPRGLALTGRNADGWIPSYGYAPPEQIVGMRDLVLRAAEEAGRDRSEITCAYNVEVTVAPRVERVDGELIGPPDYLIEQSAALLDLGFSVINFMTASEGHDDQMARIAAEIVPALRGTS
jgi:alkanesulfonate monooxygenase SsuD/methylene tetrahydromethanopterin reductase-like flavin-dependent oxidoreductase (luciferase family)